MLALPPSDPRNWYRQAVVHLLDCPHANWWFLPWHRGYLLHFEEICRDLSGDPEFALPFWDWTSSPRVPDALFDDVLTPTHQLYEESFQTFRPKFEPAISDLWNGLTVAQRDQLTLRGYASPADVWAKLESYFSVRDEARKPTRDKPDLPDWAQVEVGAERVTAALAPKRFEDFGSTPTDHHHQRGTQDTLEAGPHNNIHNALGGGPGLMSELLAPVDPIFWLHHANVDRLWDLWTRRERQAGRTAMPDDADRWKREPLLFFAGGDVVAERYLETSALGYRYSDGFGDEILQESHPPAGSRAGLACREVRRREGGRGVAHRCRGECRRARAQRLAGGGTHAEGQKEDKRRPLVIECSGRPRRAGARGAADPQAAATAPRRARTLLPELQLSLNRDAAVRSPLRRVADVFRRA